MAAARDSWVCCDRALPVGGHVTLARLSPETVNVLRLLRAARSVTLRSCYEPRRPPRSNPPLRLVGRRGRLLQS